MIAHVLLAWALTHGLGAGDWRAREAASARLAALGVEAEPALLLCGWSEDLEVRFRAAQLRRDWADDAAAIGDALAKLDREPWLRDWPRPWRWLARSDAGEWP